MADCKQKPLPYLSLYGSIACAASLIILTGLNFVHTQLTPVASQQVFVLYVMMCVLVALVSSVVSLITAWCPIILGGDSRPLYWVVPLVLAWLVFAQAFDWRWLVPF